MRVFFTLLILFAGVVGKAQVDSLLKHLYAPCCPVAESKKPATAVNIQVKSYCGLKTKTTKEEPFIVIDGMPCEYGELQKLNPGDIASIDILKEPAAKAFFCHGSRGAIIVTTKKTVKREFIVKDATDSSVVPGATISLIAKNETINGAANTSGAFSTNKLKPGTKYELLISAVGYKTIKQSFTPGFLSTQQAFLERDIELAGQVVIVCYYKRRYWDPPERIDARPTGSKTAELQKEEKTVVKPIYPNPVQRSHVFNLEFENEKEPILQLSIVGLDGKTVMQQPQRTAKGLNRISIIADTRWAAGIYVVGLRNEKGDIIKQDKLVVQ